MTPPALVGTVLDAKFQIEKALSSGAAGDVYEATHLGLGSRVAVKVLRPGIPETADIRRRRFMREARVAARVQSDHVVRVFDIVCPVEGPPYIVMELLQGETLAERLRREKTIPFAQAIDYVMQAAKPLADMHEAGIVHRDVKPSNLFLARDAEGRERVKLLDFGVAAFCQAVIPRGSDLTLTETVIGTPRYMAPEQFRDAKQVDGSADVWALGITLYELLAGAPPFDGRTVLAVMNQIELQQAPPLQKKRPDIPPALAALVHRCLAKDPAKRPANGRALLDALATVSGHAPAPAPTIIAEASLIVDPSLEDRAESLADIDAELLTTATPITLPKPRRTMLVAAAALTGIAAGIAVLVALGRVSRATPDANAHPDTPAANETRATTATAVAEPPAPPATLVITPPPERARPAVLTATSGGGGSMSAPSPTLSAREAPAARRAAPKPAARPAAKPAARPAPAAKSSGRSSTEDDDRIE